jgi:predicted RNA-binding protein associated with RNAse of E/G family
VSPTRIVFTKWGGLPHWEYDAVRLGEDEHGTWLGVPRGTLVGRPEARFHTDVHQVVLVPEAGFVATFFAPGGRAPCDLYVDIATVPVVTDRAVSTVDLDLDVIRGWTGRVWVDDEDEFAEHRVRYGYPDPVVEHAVRSCEEVRRAVELSQAPFDPATSRRWLSLVDDAMMAR